MTKKKDPKDFLKRGRPTKYKPELCKHLIQFFNIDPIIYKDITITKADGTQIDKTEMEAAPTPYFVDWQMSIDISDETMLRWVKKYPEFCGAYNRAKKLQEKFLMECGLKEVHGGFITALSLKNVSGWRDKHEFEGEGLKANVSIRIVQATVSGNPNSSQGIPGHREQMASVDQGF